MDTRRLGRSDLTVSAIGMGCWAIGGPWQMVDPGGNPHPAGWSAVDDAESTRAIQAALEAGVTLFDTAANYGAGHSERVLGAAVAGQRSEVVIATKFGYLVNEETKEIRADDTVVIDHVRTDCEASLRRLGTEYIDLYQLHVNEFDPDLAVELRDVLEELVTEGKIRWYGWSTDDAARAAVFAGGVHGTAVQFAYNAFSEKFAMRDLLAEADLGGLSRSPLAMGILTGKMTRATTFPADDVRTQFDLADGHFARLLDVAGAMRTVLTAGGHTPAQAALAWILTGDERIVPIPGFKTVAQVEENLAALDMGLLTIDQMVRLEGIRAAHIDAVRAYYDPAHAEDESPAD